MAFNLGGFNVDLNKIGDMVNKGKDAVTTIDEPKEIEIGSGMASTLLGAAPLVDNEALQRYVNRIGLWIAMQTERPDLPWRFGVIDTESINAFAAPGGFVFVTKGLFMSFRDEAELAGVLAHEIGHVLRRHHLEAIRKNAQVGLVKDVALMFAEKKGANIDLLINTGMELYAKGLDKDDEYESDLIGIVLAARAGYDPYGLNGVLMTLDNINPADGAVALMFKTHPSAGDRLRRLEAGQGPEFEALAGGPRVEQRLLSVQQGLMSAR